MKIQADDIEGFGLEIWIAAGRVALQPVRLDAGFLPDAVNQILTNTQKGSRVCGNFNASVIHRPLAYSIQYLRSQITREPIALLAGMAGM